jgi:hypothetical protein
MLSRRAGTRACAVAAHCVAARRHVATNDAANVAKPKCGPWLVVDMDGTIVPTPSKAGGHYEPLTTSPCYAPLRSWIRHGGNLCVVSTAGRRMFTQVYEPLKDDLLPTPEYPRPGRLIISGYNAASMFASEADGTLVENADYRHLAVEGGTCIPRECIPEFKALFTERFRRLFEIASHDPTFISALSKKYHEPYSRLVALRKEMGAQRFNAEILTDATLTTPGAVLKSPKNSMLGMLSIPGTEAVAQVSMLGVPSSRFDELFGDAHIENLARLGLAIHRQPNSVVICRSAVTKGTCVNWLQRHSETYGFDVANAIAIGDAPITVDRVLLQFPGMPFVSVSPTPDDDPLDRPHLVRVGGEEVGCARMLTALVSAVWASSASPASANRDLGKCPSFAELQNICQTCRIE